MSERIRRLSEEVARDPSGLSFLELGEALRREGQLDLARTVALRGLERHPHNADAHDLLARVHADQGELQHAFDEWDAARRLAPRHVGALKGMGYVLFRGGRLQEAERCLSEAAMLDGEDGAIAAALDAVRSALAGRAAGAADRGSAGNTTADARSLFADILGQEEQSALLVDDAGFVTAGLYVTPAGEDVTAAVGAELAGMRGEVERTVKHLRLGEWSAVVFETELATVAMSPVARDSLLLLAADRAVPLGFVRRVMDRCAQRAEQWLGVGT